MTPDQYQAILDFLTAGKGIAGAYVALDSFYDWDAYRALCGGGQIVHTKLGRCADVWTTPSLLEYILEGLSLVAGRIEAPNG